MLKNLLFLVIWGNIHIRFTIASNIDKPVNSCTLMDTCLKDDKNNIKLPYKSDNEYNCYCDQKCKIYQDCCGNFIKENNKTALEEIKFNCNLARRIFDKDKKTNFIYSIGVCPNEYPDFITKINCNKSNDAEIDHEDTFLKWPFYSNLTNYTYNNIYCAICNHEKMIDLHPWQAAFNCDKSVNITNSSQILEKYKNKCNFTKWMHSFMQFRHCRNNLIQTCLPRSDSLIENNCINGPYRIRYSSDGSLVFRNEFCAACNGIMKPTCKQPNSTNKEVKSTATEITFSLFFDFNFFDGEYEVGFKRFQNDDVKLKKVNCDHDSFFDPVRSNFDYQPFLIVI